VTAVDTTSAIVLVEDETQKLLEWAASITDSDDTYLGRAQTLARRLGAHYRKDGLTELGFWAPELAGEVIQSDRVLYLQVFTPMDEIGLRSPEQTVQFRCDRIPIAQQGEYIWGVVSGMRPGTRHQLGSLYWLRYLDPQNILHSIHDVVAYSLPYGVFAPAELYDIDRLQRQRADLDYFRRTAEPTESGEIPRVPAPVNLLQLHVSTASAAGTLEGLTEVYRTISNKLAAGEPLTPAEENYVGYDGVQLLPVEPTIEYRREDDNTPHEFFSIEPEQRAEMEQEIIDARLSSDTWGSPNDTRELTVTLRKPNTHNWGYDIPIIGSSATNPAILGSLRPDEVVDFIATLHNFSQGPMLVVYDLVYGHADNQAEQLISRQYLKGPNMYGQDLNHQLPVVRANLLEMQRRKIDTGADGIRVDGGQDFRFFNPLSGRVEQDDAYLLAMSDVVQEIEGHQRLLFTIFEDGRPWPAEGWEETSTYLDLVTLRPESYQWGPLIFAHNTPALEGFWDYKWRRVSEVMYQGDRWITGCANHDTIRRGTQIDPEKAINWNLGQTLPQVLKTAYDNPAITLWVYGFSPGLPMDFINALMRAPWGFFRNTDDRYGVKVASEEMGFLDWQVDAELYQQSDAFARMKTLGFDSLEGLRSFGRSLAAAMGYSEYDLEAVARICQTCLGDSPDACEIPSLRELNQPGKSDFLSNLDVLSLKRFAMDFMEDMHDFCNVSHYLDQVDAQQARFNRRLRDYRRTYPWLRENLQGVDRFNRISEGEHTLFYGLRSQPLAEGQSPDEAMQVAMIAHMGGKPAEVALADWLQLDMSEWRVAIATPGLDITEIKESRVFGLTDQQGVLLEKMPVASFHST